MTAYDLYQQLRWNCDKRGFSNSRLSMKNVKPQTGLGCKRSQIRILSRRPLYVIDNSQFSYLKTISTGDLQKVKTSQKKAYSSNIIVVLLRYSGGALYRANSRLISRYSDLIVSNRNINFHSLQNNRTNIGLNGGVSMARVNIEEEAWRRIHNLADIMDCSVREAAGTVACLWTESQDVIKTHGSKDEIKIWAKLFKLSDEEVEKWILGLENARFISSTENGQFKIHGNDIQLEHRIKNIARATKGGNALKKKLSDLKRLKASSKQASSTLQASSKRPNTRQDKAKQDKAIQGNSTQDNAEQGILIGHQEILPSSNDSAPKEKTVIAFYCDEWKDRYRAKKHPPITSKTAGQINSLVKDFGEKRARDLIQAYLQMPDSWFVTKSHDIPTLLQNLNKISHFIDTGKLITRREISQLDNQSTNQNTLDALREGEI